MQYKQEKKLHWLKMNTIYSQDFIVIRKTPLWIESLFM